jgi:hypothetical protein
VDNGGVTDTFAMAVRTGNWGTQGIMLSFHAPVSVQLAPADAPGVLVRIVHGVPSVDRELTGKQISSLVLANAGGAPLLTLTPAARRVERRHPASEPTDWALVIEGSGHERLHLYSRPGTRFPTDQVIDALTSVVAAPES